MGLDFTLLLTFVVHRIQEGQESQTQHKHSCRTGPHGKGANWIGKEEEGEEID